MTRLVAEILEAYLAAQPARVEQTELQSSRE